MSETIPFTLPRSAQHRRAPDVWAPRALSAAVVVALHGAVVVGLLAYQPTRQALLEAKAIMVDIIRPEPPPLPPKIEPPKPLPMVPLPRRTLRPPPPPPIVAATPTPTSPPREDVYVPPAPPPLPRIETPLPPPAPVAAPAPPAAPPAPPVVIAPPPPLPTLPITPPRFDAAYLANPTPAYPPMSRRLGEQGQVMLRVLVSEDGRPTRVDLQKSSGFDRLDQAALNTVRDQFRFVPAKQGDRAVSGWAIVPINFTLGN